MGQASNINEPANNNKRTNRLTALAFFEIGIFEIIFVITLLLIIFGTLNYFNILYVSETFPKYLGWLPSQRAGDIYRNKTNNQVYNDFLKQYYAFRREVPSGTSRPTSTPTPTPPVSTLFINNTLIPYLASVISEKAAISGISEHPAKTNNTDKNIVINLDTKEGTISGFLTLSNSQNISSVNLSVTETAPFPSPNPPFDLIQKEALKFFSIEPKGQWGCKTFKETAFDLQFCENFWTETDGTKRGIYYQNPTMVDAITKETKAAFAFCEFRIGSSSYDWKSCISAFSKNGI